MDPQIELKRLIRVRRYYFGLTQRELAKKVGVDYTTVSSWEKGIRRPRPHSLARLATALDLGFEQLIQYYHEPNGLPAGIDIIANKNTSIEGSMNEQSIATEELQAMSTTIDQSKNNIDGMAQQLNEAIDELRARLDNLEAIVKESISQ